MISRKILVAGAVCAAVTVVTTFIVHLVQVPAATFEERLQLSSNSTYIWRNITTILHCICVAISMAALAHAGKEKPGGTIKKWGAISFMLFSLMETVRMVSALVYANGLRAQYLASTDPAQQELIRFALETQWPLIAAVLFTLFIIMFGLGCLFMGIGLVERGSKLDMITGSLFIFWGIQSFTTIANEQLGWGLDTIIFWLSITFQPAMRLLVVVWFVNKIRSDVS